MREVASRGIRGIGQANLCACVLSKGRHEGRDVKKGNNTESQYKVLLYL